MSSTEMANLGTRSIYGLMMVTTSHFLCMDLYSSSTLELTDFLSLYFVLYFKLFYRIGKVSYDP